ncbi:ubiquinol-cytochrome c reductase iron-sulfur subunit [bacterium]|nr:ubiquinol-cytochrome c reductase iron-sulfur subunit [bacterium]
MSEKNFSRRNFIKSSVLGIIGSVVAGKAIQAAAGDYTINVDDFEPLQAVGGSVLIKDVTVGADKDNLIVVRTGEKEFVVFSAICRHKKCNVKYKHDKNAFVCPCHGSTYDMTGQVTKGPSKDNIIQYKVKLTGNQLTVTV